MAKLETIPQAAAGRKRRFTSEHKGALLDEAARTGNSISEAARRYSGGLLEAAEIAGENN